MQPSNYNLKMNLATKTISITFGHIRNTCIFLQHIEDHMAYRSYNVKYLVVTIGRKFNFS